MRISSPISTSKVVFYYLLFVFYYLFISLIYLFEIWFQYQRTAETNFDIKIQKYVSEKERGTINQKKLYNNIFSSPLHAWLEFRATETLAKCRRKVQITAHQNHFSQFSERQAQLLLTSNSKRRTTRNKSLGYFQIPT